MKFRLLKLIKINSSLEEKVYYVVESKAHVFAKWQRVYDTSDLGKAGSLYNALIKRGKLVFTIDISTLMKDK